MRRIDAYAGALLGLAVGDAIGTTVEFKRPGSFAPVKDMTGGGPFGLAPGQWTDDTSMLVGALLGTTKEELLSRRYAEPAGYWDEHPLDPSQPPSVPHRS